MSIIGKKLPEFTLDAFKKPELVKVSTADVLGKWSVFVFYPADFTFVCPTELEDVQNSYAELKELGCDIIQGYLFSRPLSPEQTELMLMRWDADVAALGKGF